MAIKPKTMSIKVSLPVPTGEERHIQKLITKARAQGLGIRRAPDSSPEPVYMSNGTKGVIVPRVTFEVAELEPPPNGELFISINEGIKLPITGRDSAPNIGSMTSRYKVFTVNQDNKVSCYKSGNHAFDQFLDSTMLATRILFKPQYKIPTSTRAYPTDDVLQAIDAVLRCDTSSMDTPMDTIVTAAICMATKRPPADKRLYRLVREASNQKESTPLSIRERLVEGTKGLMASQQIVNAVTKPYIVEQDVLLVARACEGVHRKSISRLDIEKVRSLSASLGDAIAVKGVIESFSSSHDWDFISKDGFKAMHYVNVRTEDNELVRIAKPHSYPIDKAEIISMMENAVQVEVFGTVKMKVDPVILADVVRAPAMTSIDFQSLVKVADKEPVLDIQRRRTLGGGFG